MTSTIARRPLLGAILALPMLGRRAHAADPLYINTWGGVWQESAVRHLFQPFTARTGIEIRTISPVSYAKLAAQARTGTYDFDITTVSASQAVQAEAENIIEVPNPRIIDVAGLPAGSVYRRGVASHCYSTNIVFAKRRLEAGSIRSWADVWNVERFPGRRTLSRTLVDIFPIALMADGVPAETDRVYPIDQDRAFRSMDRIRPHVPVWWAQGPQVEPLLRDGEVEVASMWHSAALNAIANGTPLELVWNQAKINRVYWVVSRGTPRAEMAWQFIKFATSPENLAGFCAMANYGPLYEAAFNHLPDNVSRNMPTFPDNHRLALEEDAESIGAMLTPAQRRFNSWLQR